LDIVSLPVIGLLLLIPTRPGFDPEREVVPSECVPSGLEREDLEGLQNLGSCPKRGDDVTDPLSI
jgi:hypothetical protein